jgi:hypothetical protein
MDRAFTTDDDGRRFKLAGTKDRDWGLLEYPLTDPGSLTAAEARTHGILWFTHNDRMPATWRYVEPTDVERVRSWHEWPAPEQPVRSVEPIPFHRTLQHD